jgi:hypothetical protein
LVLDLGQVVVVVVEPFLLQVAWVGEVGVAPLKTLVVD